MRSAFFMRRSPDGAQPRSGSRAKSQIVSLARPSPMDTRRSAVNCADIRRRDAAVIEPIEYGRNIRRPDRQQKTVAWESLQPSLDRYALRPRHTRNVDLGADAGAFRQHEGGADQPALGNVLGRGGEARLCECRQHVKIGNEPRRSGSRCRFPVGKRFAVAAAQIDRRNQAIDGTRVEGGEKLFGAAEDRDRKLTAIGTGIGVAADDRHAIGVAPPRAGRRAQAPLRPRPRPIPRRPPRSAGRPWRRRPKRSPSRRTSRRTMDRARRTRS